MTTVHPIIDTVVQINDEDESDQEEQITEQHTSNRDQTTNDEIIGKKQTNSTTQAINSKSDELNERIENNSNQFESEKSDINDEVDNLEKNSDQRTNENDSISSKSSHSLSSSLSSASSSDQDKQEQKEPNSSVLDRGQTIFKPILNGLTNSNLFRPKQADKEQDKFSFTWSNLSYFVHITSRFGLGKKKKKYIFNQINGELKSNQLFGLLGPSGAGKSSLLDCLSLKCLKNVSGQIKINGKLNKYKMAYIPQNDEYFEDLTCLEILSYASRLKNNSALIDDTLLTLNKEVIDQQKNLSTRLETFHHRVAKNVLNLLGLTEQQNTYAGRLSGGQKKRLSIAQELVIKPHIIFSDELTSGLDSNSAYQCMNLLNQLTKQSTPIAICLTIHQPSPRILQLFDQIYVLSNYGKVIYNASPLDVVSRLHQENINVPIHYNPADFLLELASGEYDPSYIQRMADQVKCFEQNNLHQSLITNEGSKDAIKAFAVNITDNFISQFNTLFSRCWLLTIRNPMLTTNRIIAHLFLAIFIGWVFGPDVGKASDCPAKMSMLLDTEEIAKMTNNTIESAKNVMDNMSSVFFGILVMLLGSLLPTLVTFPLEVKILQKEYFNGWYGINSYFFARLIADLPLQIFVPFMYVSITYYLNGQSMEYFRFTNYSLIFVLTAVVAQCHGVIVSAIFSKNLMTAVFLGPVTALPLLLFSGFLVRIERMPWIMRPLTYVSYMRFSFEGIVISIYGFNRCGDDAVKQVKRIRSQLDTYFTNLMDFVTAGINCQEDWDKANLVMMEDNLTNHLELNSIGESLIDEASQKLILQSDENKTDSGLNNLFNNLLDVMFNSQLSDDGKIVPRVMQLFDLKDAYLFRSIYALLIFVLITRIISYYIIKYKATLRG